MFTGIVTEVGRIAEIEPADSGRRIMIEGSVTADGLSIGDSVAVNGVCLTAVAIDGDTFSVEAVTETLERSNLGALAAGVLVDLERPVALAGRFDGSVVQGHVDGVGTIEESTPEGGSQRVRVRAPSRLAPYLVEKGSVTVDGVNLTITAVSPIADDHTWFEVVLIPHTLDVTVLGDRSVGDRVNLEADIFAKYVERLLEART